MPEKSPIKTFNRLSMHVQHSISIHSMKSHSICFESDSDGNEVKFSTMGTNERRKKNPLPNAKIEAVSSSQMNNYTIIIGAELYNGKIAFIIKVCATKRERDGKRVIAMRNP